MTEAARLAIKRIDKAASKGVIHKNQAARRKSRLLAQIKRRAGRRGLIVPTSRSAFRRGSPSRLGIRDGPAGSRRGPARRRPAACDWPGGRRGPPPPARGATPSCPAGRGRPRPAGRVNSRSRSEPSLRPCCSALRAGNVEPLRPSSSAARPLVADAGAVEGQHPQEWFVRVAMTWSGCQPPPSRRRCSLSSAAAMSPRSMASVSSQGFTPPSARRGRADVLDAQRTAPGPNAAAERRQQAHQQPGVLADAARPRPRRAAPSRRSTGGCAAARRATGPGPCPSRRRRRRRRPASSRRRPAWRGRDRGGPPAGAGFSHTITRPSWSSGSARYATSGATASAVVNTPAWRADDDPPVGEERRRLGGVDQPARSGLAVDLVAGGVELVDHQRAVAVADQRVRPGRARLSPSRTSSSPLTR